MKISIALDITTDEVKDLANYAIDLARQVGTEFGATIGAIAAISSSSQQETAVPSGTDESPLE